MSDSNPATASEASDETIKGIYEFLKHTPEGSLRKMLCTGDLTDAHFRLLMKLVKGGPDADFVEAFHSGGMGKLRLNPKESPLRDTFWNIVRARLVATGLLPSGKAA